MSVKIKPAKKEDLIEFYGEDLGPWTYHAYVARDEETGELLAIAGIQRMKRNVLAFCSVKEGEGENHPVIGAIMAKRVMKEIISKHPSVAIVDETIPTAPQFLERLGFESVDGKVFKWVQKQHAM